MRKAFLATVAAAILSFTVSAQTENPARPVDVPDINGMAVSAVKPAFPSTAIDVGADGTTVTVRVVVDENGTPVSATCSLTCHEMLKDPAELAALQTKFKPLVREGVAVRYQGVMLYTYVVSRIDWFRFATALESTRQFDNLSLGPVAQILSPEFEKQKTSLSSLDGEGVSFSNRQKVIAEVTAAIRSRLKGSDLWRFDLGLALRRVTFWPQAGESIDRDELQKSLGLLASMISSAPADTPKDVLRDLTTLSKYSIPPELPEQDLRRSIMEMTRGLASHFSGAPRRPGEP